jgi:hypothetical protein
MCFGDYSHATLGSVSENISQLDLSSRVKVDFGLLNVNEVALGCRPQRNEDRQDMRNPQSYVSDAHQIVGSNSPEPAHQEIYLGIVQSSCDNPPS